MEKHGWSLVDVCVWVPPGLIAAMSIYAVYLLTRWQISGQTIPQSIYDFIEWLIMAAIVLSFVLGCAVYLKAYRRESERERKENAIRSIGKLIDQGVTLIAGIYTMPSPDDWQRIENRYRVWQEEIRFFLNDYGASFTSFVLDESDWNTITYTFVPERLNDIRNSIGSCQKQLKELLIVAATR